jgi:hypothetical protein
MTIVFFFFGYKKWHRYGAEALAHYESRPVDVLLYSVFGFRGAAGFVEASEWLTCVLLSQDSGIGT